MGITLENFHSKHKGTPGEVAVTKHLLQEGHSVFSEIGDLSRTDLIVLVDRVPIKVQVKSCMAKNGVVDVPSKKNGPGYDYRYRLEDVDVFAVYVLDHDLVFYISAKEHLRNSTGSKFRVSEPLNFQKKKVRFASDYVNFKDALRDYTPGTLTGKAEGYDIVQTTTPWRDSFMPVWLPKGIY